MLYIHYIGEVIEFPMCIVSLQEALVPNILTFKYPVRFKAYEYKVALFSIRKVKSQVDGSQSPNNKYFMNPIDKRASKHRWLLSIL